MSANAHPGLGVVIAARDAGATIAATLESLGAQTYSPSEVVVVDDGSDDDTGDVARAAGAAVIRTEGLGLPAARNLGVAGTVSPVVAIADADDLFTTDHLEVHLRTMADRGADAVATDAWYWVQGRVTPFSHFDCSRPSDPVAGGDLAGGNPLLSTCVVTRAALEAAGGYDDRLPALEDYDLWLRLTGGDRVVVPAPRPTMYYRREAGMSSDGAAMYDATELVLRRWCDEGRGAVRELAPALQHAAVGAGNWAMLGGDAAGARGHWRRAQALGDDRRQLRGLVAGSIVAPALARRVLQRRLSVDGRPLPLQVVRWWRGGGERLTVQERPDQS